MAKKYAWYDEKGNFGGLDDGGGGGSGGNAEFKNISGIGVALVNLDNNNDMFRWISDGSSSRFEALLYGKYTVLPNYQGAGYENDTYYGSLMYKMDQPLLKLDRTNHSVSFYDISTGNYIDLNGTGPSGVSSLNALTGDITLSSADNSILFTKTGNVIDAKVQISGGGGNASFTETLPDVVSLTNTTSNADYLHWAKGGGVGDWFIQTLIHNNYRKLPFIVEDDNTLYITESKPYIQKNGTNWQIYDFENSAWNNFLPGNTAPIKYNGTSLYLDIDTSLTIDSTSGKLGITGTVMTTITQMMNRLLAVETKLNNASSFYQYTLTNHEVWIIKDNLTGICHCRWRQTSTTNGYDWSNVEDSILPNDIYNGVVVFSRPSSSSGASLQLTWNATAKTWSSAGTGNPISGYVACFSYKSK